MRHRLLKLSVLLLTSFLLLQQAQSQSFTQVPQGISFQAVARDLQGNPAKFRKVYIRDEIREGTASGNPVYVEIFETQTNGEGVFSIVIGKGAVSGANRSPFNRIGIKGLIFSILKSQLHLLTRFQTGTIQKNTKTWVLLSS